MFWDLSKSACKSNIYLFIVKLDQIVNWNQNTKMKLSRKIIIRSIDFTGWCLWMLDDRNFCVCTRFYGLFYVKNEVSDEISFFFHFYCGTVFTWNCTKVSEWFSDFFASKKWNWLMVSYTETGIKLWNHHFRSGKKKWNWRPRRRNCATIKNTNKWDFGWNLIFYIKQAIKSRAKRRTNLNKHPTT